MQSATSSIQTQALFGLLEDEKPLTTEHVVQCLLLKKESHLAQLQELVDARRKSQVGETVFYRAQKSLILTNQCELQQTLYDYPAEPGSKQAYVLSIDDIDAVLEALWDQQGTHVDVTGGGFWPLLRIPGLEEATLLKTYARLIAYIREQCPDIQLFGLSPDEVDFLKIVSDRSHRYVLELLKDKGLQGLSGRWTEVLDDTVRQKISPKLCRVKTWKSIAETAARLNLPVEASMSYGHYETLFQRAQHLLLLGELAQKHPNLFYGLSLQPYLKNKPGFALPQHCQPEDQWKLQALARFILGQSIPRQQAQWTSQADDPEDMAKTSLQWGANDLGSTDALSWHLFLTGSRIQNDVSLDELAKWAAPRPVVKAP